MITYRLAQGQDMDPLVEMARNFHAVSGLTKYGGIFNAEHVRDLLVNMSSGPDSLVLVAADDHVGLIYGAIGAHLSHQIMNRDQGLAIEMFQWVRPEARGHKIGSGLLTRLEHWATERGALTLVMMSMQDISGPAAALFAARGYSPTETTWVKRMGNTACPA